MLQYLNKKMRKNNNLIQVIILIVTICNDVNAEVWSDPDTYLMWEVKSDYNIMHEYEWKDAEKYCDNLELVGYDDWWVPSTSQLKSLANIELFGEYSEDWEDWFLEYEEEKNGGYFIKEFFEYNMGTEGDYWSLSDYATGAKSEEEQAWFVDFEAGYDDWTYTTSQHYVRCVRSSY